MDHFEPQINAVLGMLFSGLRNATNTVIAVTQKLYSEHIMLLERKKVKTANLSNFIAATKDLLVNTIVKVYLVVDK